MQREPSFGEWLYAPCLKTPNWIKALAGAVLVAGLALAGGMWLGARQAPLTRVTLVPGVPTGVSIDNGPLLRDSALISRLRRDLNDRPVFPADTVGSCLADGPRTDTLQFQYANGDRLTVRLISLCSLVAIADYTPSIEAKPDPAILDDLSGLRLWRP